VTRVDEDVVRQLEQASDRAKELAGAWFRVPARVQIGPPDVADEKRVSGEDEPGLIRSAPPVGDEIGVVGGSMSGRGEGTNKRVPQLDHVSVAERDVGKLDPCVRGKVGSRSSCIDQRR
jgi:hypothetical protein